eukprot:tig00021537_g22283.t1
MVLRRRTARFIPAAAGAAPVALRLPRDQSEHRRIRSHTELPAKAAGRPGVVGLNAPSGNLFDWVQGALGRVGEAIWQFRYETAKRRLQQCACEGENQQTVDRAVAYIRACPKANELLESVRSRHGELTFLCDTGERCWLLKAGLADGCLRCSHFDSRHPAVSGSRHARPVVARGLQATQDGDEICVRCGLSLFTTVGMVLMELINASNADRFASLMDRARSGKIAREQFAVEFEQVEYSGLRRQHQIVTACCAARDWKREADFFKGRYRTFESYLIENDRPRVPGDPDSSHTGLYRKMWDEQRTRASPGPAALDDLRWD